MRELEPENISSEVGRISRVWQELATHASHMAHARRTLFNAYIAEGFNEIQALELVKHI